MLSYSVSLDDLDAFVDQEFGSIDLGGGTAIPSARTKATGFLCRLKSRFCIGMGNPSADVLGLPYRLARNETRSIMAAGPDVIRHFGYRRDIIIGVMWIHSPKYKMLVPKCCRSACPRLYGKVKVSVVDGVDTSTSSGS